MLSVVYQDTNGTSVKFKIVFKQIQPSINIWKDIAESRNLKYIQGNEKTC